MGIRKVKGDRQNDRKRKDDREAEYERRVKEGRLIHLMDAQNYIYQLSKGEISEMDIGIQEFARARQKEGVE